jgi:hypothetical protein
MNKFYLSLLLMFCVSGLIAQSPGGVSSNLSVWIRADASSTLSPGSGSLNSWTYFNNSSNAYTATAGSQPTVAPSSFNFLPSVSFNGTQFMSGPAGTGAPIPALSLAYSVFAVWSSTAPVGSGNQRVWVQRPASSAYDQNFDGAALWIYASQANPPGPQYGDQPEVSPFTTGLGLTYTPNTQYISQLNLLDQNTNDLELVDQTNIGTAPVVVSTDPNNNATMDRILSNGANLLGARSTAIDEPLFGNLAELIIYTGPVSGASRNEIFSYLSMKYGIPTGTSLLSSAGTTVWDAVGNAAYNNFVFGLGQDNTSGLLNTQSNSAGTGSGNGAGQSGMGNIVLSGPSSLSDQNFMMVGSNNAGFTETTSNLPSAAGAGSARLPNQWLVQNTGNVGTVNLSFDFTGITTTGAIGTTADFRLMVDNTGSGNFGTSSNVTFYAPTSFTGSVANFTAVDLSKSSKVVLGILSNAGTGTPLPITWVNFTALAAGNNVNLNWTVGANENAKVYDVEHSTDGINFTTIGEVPNVANVQSYQFVHTNAGNGTHYYRIHEVDFDGSAIYSKIVSVNINTADFSIQVLNNPAANNTDAQLEINPLKPGNASIEIWTTAGARVATIVQTVNPGTNMVRIPLSGLASMSYVVKVTVNGTTHVTQIVKL